MKTFNKKDVLTALNREDAEIYIGEKGYYCYRMHDWMPCELLDVHFDEDYDVREVFTVLDHKTEHDCPMFLPADKVKEIKEKKYRPFNNFSEFRTVTNTEVGEMLTLKSKIGDIIRYVLVEGVLRFPDLRDEIYLSTINQNNSISYTYLFDSFLFLDRTLDEWRVLGVEE